MTLLYSPTNYTIDSTFHERIFRRVKKFRPTLTSCTPEFVGIMKGLHASTYVFDLPQIARPPLFLCLSVDAVSAYLRFEGVPIIALDENQIAEAIMWDEAIIQPIFLPWTRIMVSLASHLATQGDLRAAADIADHVHLSLTQRAEDCARKYAVRNIPLRTMFDMAHAFIMGHECGHYLVRDGKQKPRSLMAEIQKKISADKDVATGLEFMNLEMWPSVGLRTREAPAADNPYEEITCDIFGLCTSLMSGKHRARWSSPEQGTLTARDVVPATMNVFLNLHLREQIRHVAQTLAHWRTRRFLSVPDGSFLRRLLALCASADVLRNFDQLYPDLGVTSLASEMQLSEAAKVLTEIRKGFELKSRLLTALYKDAMMAAVIPTLGGVHGGPFSPCFDDAILDAIEVPDALKGSISPVQAAIGKACFDAARIAISGPHARPDSPYYRASNEVTWEEMAKIVYRPVSDLESNHIEYPFNLSEELANVRGGRI